MSMNTDRLWNEGMLSAATLKLKYKLSMMTLKWLKMESKDNKQSRDLLCEMEEIRKTLGSL